MEQVDDEELRGLMEEVRSLRQKRQDLCIRKQYLICRNTVSRPLKFKDCEPLSSTTKITKDEQSLSKCKLLLRMKMYELCGIKFTKATENNLRVELAFACESVYKTGFFVEIEKTDDCFRVSSFNVPYAINMKEIEKEAPIQGHDDIVVFLPYLHRCIHAYFHRKSQVSDLVEYCNTHDIDIDMFSSHHKQYIKITVPSQNLANCNENLNITFVLKYNRDSYLPHNVSFEEDKLSESDQSAINKCKIYLLEKHLKEAFRNIIVDKRVKEDLLILPEVLNASHNLSKQGSIPLESQTQFPQLLKKSSRNESHQISTSSINISSITTSEVVEKPKTLEDIRKKRPIASSTPFIGNKKVSRQNKTETNEERSIEDGTPVRLRHKASTKYRQLKLSMGTESLK